MEHIGIEQSQGVSGLHHLVTDNRELGARTMVLVVLHAPWCWRYSTHHGDRGDNAVLRQDKTRHAPWSFQGLGSNSTYSFYPCTLSRQPEDRVQRGGCGTPWHSLADALHWFGEQLKSLFVPVLVFLALYPGMVDRRWKEPCVCGTEVWHW